MSTVSGALEHPINHPHSLQHNLSASPTSTTNRQAQMRLPRIDLACPESIATCLAIENLDECVHNPRWIEEYWSVERVESLQRTQEDLKHDSESYSRHQRVDMSRRIVHGQVCLEHARHAKRLHTLQMIRGDARSDLATLSLPEIQSGRARIAAVRRAKKKVVRAVRSLTPEKGRAGVEDLTKHLGEITSCSSGKLKQMTKARSRD